MSVKKCYVIICDLEGGIKIDSIWLNFNNASNRFKKLRERRKDVYAYNEKRIEFENDDVYLIKESYIKDSNENKSKS